MNKYKRSCLIKIWNTGYYVNYYFYHCLKKYSLNIKTRGYSDSLNPFKNDMMIFDVFFTKSFLHSNMNTYELEATLLTPFDSYTQRKLHCYELYVFIYPVRLMMDQLSL